MVNGVIDPCPGAHDLGLEQGDARMKFVYRERIEVLPRELRHEVARRSGLDVVEIHACKVDPFGDAVNEPRDEPLFAQVRMIPDMMIAIDPSEPGGPEVLLPVERAVPRAGPGDYLVRVAAAGVNRPDIMQRKGGYPPPPGAPTIPGLEIAGMIVAAGEGADSSRIGTQVCALIAGGGYAEYAIAPAGQCLVVPNTLSLVEAAAIPETLFTVWSNLFERAYARDGETILVHGGTSGIGTMAILLGRLFGLTVIVTAGSDAKCARALQIGATHAINYKSQDFVAEVKDLTEGRGVDVVLDMVGGDYVSRNIECLRDDGRHVSIATQRGVKAEIPIGAVMRRRLTLTGSTLRPRDVGFKTGIRDEIERLVWPLVEEGRLKPIIDRTFPLREAAAAHAALEQGDHVGKIVLTVD